MTRPAEPWRNGQRILVLIPHPDDEIVGCHAATSLARIAGAQVFGVMLTTGVPAQDVLWRWQRSKHAAHLLRRRDEAQAAIRALNYTDVRFRDLPTRQLRLNLAQARKETAELISEWRIDAIWTPAYEGGHTDHDCTNALAASLRGTVSQVFEFSEYNFCGGRINAQTFPKPDDSEFVISLSAAEREAKRAALASYASAQRDLSYVGVERECLRPLSAYDYTHPPHPGKLFYQRFHWVPFRHPAIDFTRPEEVCADIQQFLKECGCSPVVASAG